MKSKTTRKFLRGNYTIINTGYCNIQNLLWGQSADYYCTRAEGWAFDAYIFGDYAILDGYACIGEMKPLEILRKYDNKAKEITEKYPWTVDYNDTIEAIRELIYKFCEEVTA